LGGDEISAESIARAVASQKLLLVLDNCEHVIEAAAKLAETIIRLCPRTTILATSREILKIEGEYVYRVPALDVPPQNEASANILDHSAVQLFMVTTRALCSDFPPSKENLSAIAAICRCLDGIPLAIDLAATRVASLGLQQVAADLDDRLGVLTSGRRTALPRHQTLRATLDWSHELLPEPERLVMRRVAVFAGDFTAEAARVVTSDGKISVLWRTSSQNRSYRQRWEARLLTIGYTRPPAPTPSRSSLKVASLTRWHGDMRSITGVFLKELK
jgi:non-specific serine/threonine protein kinase